MNDEIEGLVSGLLSMVGITADPLASPEHILLSNLISRPIKHGGLGEYCFIILAEGHVADDLMADTMRSLHAKQASVKWFGSWPRADGAAHDVRAHADQRWRQADDWIAAIRHRVL